MVTLRVLFFVGDFNAKDIRWGYAVRSNALGQRLYDYLVAHGYSQLVTKPTRETENSSSLLDLIIIDIPNLFSDVDTLPPLFYLCDHCIIHGKLYSSLQNIVISANFLI
jgi:hypothetical protein